MVHAPLRIFISHSHADNAFAQRLAHDLRTAIGSDDAVWMDASGGLNGGDAWWSSIRKEIRARSVFLVVLSPDAMHSSWVNSEVDIAWKLRQNAPSRIIIPLVYRPCEIRDDLDTLQNISFLPPHAYMEARDQLFAVFGISMPVPVAAAPLVPSSLAVTPIAPLPLPQRIARKSDSRRVAVLSAGVGLLVLLLVSLVLVVLMKVSSLSIASKVRSLAPTATATTVVPTLTPTPIIGPVAVSLPNVCPSATTPLSIAMAYANTCNSDNLQLSATGKAGGYVRYEFNGHGSALTGVFTMKVHVKGQIPSACTVLQTLLPQNNRGDGGLTTYQICGNAYGSGNVSIVYSNKTSQSSVPVETTVGVPSEFTLTFSQTQNEGQITIDNQVVGRGSVPAMSTIVYFDLALYCQQGEPGPTTATYTKFSLNANAVAASS